MSENASDTEERDAVRTPPGGEHADAHPRASALKPRTFPASSARPRFPYPVLAPYTHPDTFKGRDRSIRTALDKLSYDKPLLLGLHAPSGAGKSSFLLAGLAPALRKAGRPVAIIRNPDWPGIARRLLSKVFEVPADFHLDDASPEHFVRVVAASTRPGERPVFVLDQFEQLFEREHALSSLGASAGPTSDHDPNATSRASALRAIGALLVATARDRPPHEDGHLCQWVISCREDAYGRATAWLRSLSLGGPAATEEARGGVGLASHRHLSSMRLPPFGADGAADATEAFREAILGPLELRKPDGTPEYPWRIDPETATRLAAGFARSRVSRENDALVPELQLVLHKLLVEARDAEPHGSTHRVVLTEEPEHLIRHALLEHVRESLFSAFAREPRSAQIGRRTQAFLALLLLVDRETKQPVKMPEPDYLSCLPRGGEQWIAKLTAERCWLLAHMSDEDDPERALYALPHEVLASQLLLLRDDDAQADACGLDTEKIRLFRTLQSRTATHERRPDPPIDLAEDTFRRLEKAIDDMPLSPGMRAYWGVCAERRPARRRRPSLARAAQILGVVVAALGLVALALWYVRGIPARHRPGISSSAQYEDAKTHHAEWRSVWGHREEADRHYARSLVERSLLAGARGELDIALLLRLQALTVVDSLEERREIGELASYWSRFTVLSPRSEVTVRFHLSERGGHAAIWSAGALRLWRLGEAPAFVATIPGNGVERVSFSEDESTFLIQTNDGARAYSSRTGRPIGDTFPLTGGGSGRVSLSADGSLLLVDDAAGLGVFRTNTGEEVARPSLTSARWSPAGNRLVQVSGNQLLIWDADTKATRTFTLGAGVASLRGFDPTGQLVTISERDAEEPMSADAGAHPRPRTMLSPRHVGERWRVVRLEDGAALGPPLALVAFTRFVAMHEDGGLITSANNQTLQWWDIRTATLAARLERACPGDVGSAGRPFVSSDEVAIDCGSGAFVRYQKSSGALFRAWTVADRRAFDAEGAPATVHEHPGHVLLFERLTWQDARRHLGHSPETELLITEDARFALQIGPLEQVRVMDRGPGHDRLRPVVGDVGYEVLDARLWSLSDSRPVDAPFDVGVEAFSKGVRVVSSGSVVAVLAGRWMRIVDVSTASSECETSDLAQVTDDAELSSDGRWLARTSAAHGELELWDTKRCRRIGKPIRLGRPVSGLSFQPRGDHLIARVGTTYRLFRATSKRLVDVDAKRLLREGVEEARFVGRKTIVAENRKQLELIAAEDGSELCTTQAIKAPGSWALSRDETWLAVVHGRKLQLRRARGCVEVGEAIELNGSATLSFDSRGRTLLAASGHWLHLFDVTEKGLAPRAMRRLSGRPVQPVREISPDSGRFLAVVRAGSEHHVHIEEVSVRTTAEPVEGAPTALLRSWESRLGVEITDNGHPRPSASFGAGRRSPE